MSKFKQLSKADLSSVNGFDELEDESTERIHHKRKLDDGTNRHHNRPKNKAWIRKEKREESSN